MTNAQKLQNKACQKGKDVEPNMLYVCVFVDLLCSWFYIFLGSFSLSQVVNMTKEIYSFHVECNYKYIIYRCVYLSYVLKFVNMLNVCSIQKTPKASFSELLEVHGTMC